MLSGSTFLADKAYDRDAIRSRIAAPGGFTNILAMRNSRKGFAFSSLLYRYRDLAEPFIRKLRNARGLAARSDKRGDNFLAAIKLFCTCLWIVANDSKA